MTTEPPPANAPLPSAVPWFFRRGTDTPALRVDIYRVLIGAALIYHFYRARNDLPQAIGPSALFWPAEFANGSSVGHSVVKWIEAGGNWAESVSAFGLVLALGIMLGIATKTCAALLLILSTWIHRIAFPTTSLDDALVCVVALWLCIIPTGSTLRLFDFSQRRSWAARRVEGWSHRLLVVHLFLLHAHVALWREYAPGWRSVGPSTVLLCVVPALMLVPVAAVRIVAIGGLLASHLLLARTSGLGFAHAAMIASTPLLLFDERDPLDPGARGPKPLPAGAVIGAALILLTLIAMAGGVAATTTGKAQAWALATARVLRDVGQLVSSSGGRLPVQPLGLRFESDDGRAENLRVNGPRAQMLLNYLAVPGETDSLVFNRIATGAVRLHCRNDRSEAGLLSLTVVGSDASKNVGAYQCAPGAARFLPRDESQSSHVIDVRGPRAPALVPRRCLGRRSSTRQTTREVCAPRYPALRPCRAG